MFLWRKYRDRAIGLIGAYALLVAAIIWSGSLDPAPPAQQAAKPAVDRAESMMVEDCSYLLQGRSDTAC